MLQLAARRAQSRTYSARTVRLARSWQYPDGVDRLVGSPVFLLSPMRAGSALLRQLLDQHSRICAPHEMHLGMWRVETDSRPARAALTSLGLSAEELPALLWDRVMHLQLVKSQKSILVDGTPRNTLRWEQILGYWPEARFLVLLRHPVRIAESLCAARPSVPADAHVEQIERYAHALREAQQRAPKVLTVRYEDLAADPEAATRRITEWLGVPWEPAMLSVIGERGTSGTRTGLVAEPEPDPRDIPAGLRVSGELLGYL